MENYKKDMSDDEFRVLGTGSPVPLNDPDEDRRRRKQVSWAALALVALIGLGVFLFWPEKQPEEPPQEQVEGIFEMSFETMSVKPLGSESAVSPYTERLDTVISGHPLSLFIPHHATPFLCVGSPDESARQAVLAFQAADIRADNWEILGEFVLAGEQLSRGVSKRGFCAIVDGKVTVGTGETTPLLSEAVSKGGYFFRQYPLVDNGVAVENKPTNKTVRKALCNRGGQVFVVVSSLEETFNSFAQSLAELGVDNAVYLVGSDASFGWAVDADGKRVQFGAEDHRPNYRNESYILWK